MPTSKQIVFVLLPVILWLGFAFENSDGSYADLYKTRINEFHLQLQVLIKSVNEQKVISEQYSLLCKKQLDSVRIKLKAIDFWLRYLEPVSYKRINGPLPVEWETEVFEKFEKPYKRTGAGLTLAELYLNEPLPQKDTLLQLLKQSEDALATFQSDSITSILFKPDHFFFANRLFLLNLAAIYTTGFECPDPDNIIDELQSMISSTKEIYDCFNTTFPSDTITENYCQLYNQMEQFVASQSRDPNQFDHFDFIKDYVNPLYAINQHFIRKYHVISRSYNDYSLSNSSNSIFDKNLYNGQNRKGIFIVVDDTEKLNEIKAVGKMLFFDPILSGNGKRSCASCHKPAEYFTDTTVIAGLQFNGTDRLPRNTPSLTNVVYNHLLMVDGKHISLQNQAREVIANPVEMGCDPQTIVDNVMSCSTYKKEFQQFARLTPNYPKVTMDHIVSAISLYYSGFSDFTAPFDRAMNGKENVSAESIEGFNLFMSKAQCATCHFVPQFNGVKPPYVGSEFEVLGVPFDTTYTILSSDSGRYKMNAAFETMHAFRTGSLRNSTFTKPYMHNGVFNTMDEVIDFYNTGGGVGKGLKLDNQTLSPDSLLLTKKEIGALKAFMKTLDENIIAPLPPDRLPVSKLEAYKNRKTGGEY